MLHYNVRFFFPHLYWGTSTPTNVFVCTPKHACRYRSEVAIQFNNHLKRDGRTPPGDGVHSIQSSNWVQSAKCSLTVLVFRGNNLIWDLMRSNNSTVFSEFKFKWTCLNTRNRSKQRFKWDWNMAEVGAEIPAPMHEQNVNNRSAWAFLVGFWITCIICYRYGFQYCSRPSEVSSQTTVGISWLLIKIVLFT